MRNLMRKISFGTCKGSNDKKMKTSFLEKSSSALFRLMGIDNEKLQEKYPILPKLPSNVIAHIIDQMSFFEQLRMSQLCTDVNEYMKKKMRTITKLDIRKRNIDEATSSAEPGTHWDRHSQTYVAVRLSKDTAYLVVDEQWSNRDLHTLLSVMHVFHEWVTSVEMDAPIAELLVVSLSDVRLERWYTFQIVMKVFNNFDDDFHLESPFIRDRETYWPCVSELTILTKASTANYLARIIDYGVKSGYVIDRRQMDRLRIVFPDIADLSDKVLKKHIYHFRCWAGSLGWDHRYETEFLGGTTTTSV